METLFYISMAIQALIALKIILHFAELINQKHERETIICTQYQDN